jgi:CMP-N-acetylneuraminic acid synthetase
MADDLESHGLMEYISKAIICVVPCKLANPSRRLPLKNIKPFFRGLSLLDIKLRQLMVLFPPDRIIVASDDRKIRELLKDKDVGCTVFPSGYSGRADDLLEFYSVMLKSIKNDYIMSCYLTTPFLNQNVIVKMLKVYVSSAASVDSIVAVGRVQAKLFDAGARPVNFGLGVDYRGSDGVPPLFSWIRGLSILRTDVARKTGMDVGERPYLYEVDRIQAVDIDTQEDWDLASRIAHGVDGCQLLGLEGDATASAIRDDDATAQGEHRIIT